MPAQQPKKISVLIVDDHPALRAGVQAMLEKTPDIYVVGEAGSGEEAERLLEELRPNIILLDLKMPRVDGLEVLKAVKADERTRRIPVVILTSSQEESDLARSYDIGVNGYVVKPLDFRSLAEVVRQAGFYWLAINHAPPR